MLIVAALLGLGLSLAASPPAPRWGFNVAVNVATNLPVQVGVRELKNNLSSYLARVQNGEAVIVTDHGRPVARLLALDEATDNLARLIATGAITAPTNDQRKRPLRRARATRLVSDLVAEQRG